MKGFGFHLRFGRRGDAATSAVLGNVCRDLRALNESTESDFLRVLEHLQEFLNAAKQISVGCSSLAAVLSSEDACRAERNLHEILVRAADARHGGGAERIQALADAAAGMRDLEKRAAGLHSPVRIFNALGVYTRIERERLGTVAADFEGLSEQVVQLASDLEDKTVRIADVCAAVRRRVGDALTTATEMETRRGAELPRILESTSASLTALSWKQSQAVDLSRDLAAEFAAISDEIGETVQSLQYHDITRQRVEHVAEALEQALEDLGAGRAHAAQAAAVALLEAAHLRDADREFCGAVVRIQESLRRITARIRAMSDRTAESLEESGKGSEAFFRELDTDLTAVAAAMQGYANSTAIMASAAEGVMTAVEPIAGFAGQIEEIGLRIHRVSLNANVKAVRLGASGAALAAIAGNIQKTAGESAGEIDAVLAAIAGISASVGRLRQEGSQTGAEGLRDNRQNGEELASITAALRERGQGASSRVGEIAESGRSLSERLSALADSLRVAELFREVAERCAGSLEEVAGAPTQAGMAGALDALRSSYTMETERELHDSVLQDPSARQIATAGPVGMAETARDGNGELAGAPGDNGIRNGEAAGAAETAGLAGMAAAVAEADLGDNVELF